MNWWQQIPGWFTGDPESDMWREIGAQMAVAKAAIAAGARSDETQQVARSEGRQSGPEGIAQ